MPVNKQDYPTIIKNIQTYPVERDKGISSIKIYRSLNIIVVTT
jgi:hypothetical protein